MATSGILSPLLANVAYTCAISSGLISAPPSVRLRPNVFSESGPQVLIPILVPCSTTFGTPAKSRVLTAGILSELPRALRTVVRPWNLPSKLTGHHWWTGLSRQQVGASSIGVPGAQPFRNAVPYTTGLIEEPGWRSLTR